MGWFIEFMIQMKEVLLVTGVLLMIISYFKDNFDYLGAYYIAGVLIIAVAIVFYLISFFKKL
ncbi:hypothetical protein GW931_00710 [archaeon]|nr:hypothetical protein [archaeon]